VTIDVTGGCQVAPGAPGRAPSVAVALALLALATAAAAARRARMVSRPRKWT
jgi:MYXO-CTERM domain-containing protein